MSRRCLLLLLTLSACGSGADRRRAPAEVVTVAVLSGLGGTVEPCGCTSKPLGGLDRVAAYLEGLAKQNPALGLVVVGNTFIELDDPPAHRYEQERNKARAIAEVLKRLSPLAVVRGPRDLALHRTAVQNLGDEHRLPLFVIPESQTTKSRIDSAVHEIGGLKIGFLGGAGSAVGETGAYTAGALVLRAQGADVVIALVPDGGRRLYQGAPELDRIDVVIGGGSEDLLEPRVVDDALVVEAGDRGRYLGLLKFHRRGEGRWVYDDRGQGKRRSLEARMARLREEMSGLAEGEARAARQEKLSALEKELAGITTTAPTGPSVTWETVPMTQDLPRAPWAQERLAAYNRSLCETLTAATADRSCPPAAGGAAYAGNESCRACHAAAFPVWEGSKHAKAWETLTAAGKDCDVGCIGCHTVGFDAAGGFCRLSDAQRWADVGCESCHGPGSLHAQKPAERAAWGAAFTRGKSPETCTGCHNAEHSDQFAFDAYLPRILGPGHGSAAAAQAKP